MLSDNAYVPGVCNIGAAERQRRARSGWIALAVTVAAWAALAVTAAPATLNLLLFFPAAAAAIGLLQAGMRFCVGFGMRGLFNFGALGSESTSSETWARDRDRRRSWRLVGYACAIGAAAALAATAFAMLG